MKLALRGDATKRSSPTMNRRFDRRAPKATGEPSRRAARHSTSAGLQSTRQSNTPASRSNAPGRISIGRSHKRVQLSNLKFVRSPNEYRAPFWGAQWEVGPIDDVPVDSTGPSAGG